ncbi:alcohol dehydrogenase [Opitutaceae bacterium EW11]|nr:alcohol dehydrogenase [Opitutaceae bacterium EW11]
MSPPKLVPSAKASTDESGLELRKFLAPEFVYGRDALNLAGRYARNFGAKRALLVTDPGVVATGWADKVIASLKAEKIPAVVFHGVAPNPTDHQVAEGVELYQESGCDLIVAVGGGSPMDCAKGIGIAYANRRSVLEFEGVDEVPLPGPPLVCIPTTAGSSADVSQFSIITDTARNLKIAIISKTVVPDVALIDPSTTTTMPSELTAATGIDALVHAMEAYVSNASSPVTDIHALAAVQHVTGNLIHAIEEPLNLRYRNEMMTGSLLAGLAFSNASLGLVHAMAHSLGGLLDLPHGMCNALLLERVVAFNFPAAPERYRRIAAAMGLDVESLPQDDCRGVLLEALARLRQAAGIRAGIGSIGVARKDLHQLALNALKDPCTATNPRSVSAREIEKLYEEAF